jgi:hypothetical protein
VVGLTISVVANGDSLAITMSMVGLTTSVATNDDSSIGTLMLGSHHHPSNKPF